MPDFEDILRERDPALAELARKARALIYDVYPQTVEVVWEKQGNTGFGVGPKKLTEHFAWVMPHTGHVNLGLNQGADLPDPEGLLEGTGDKFRHVKLRSLVDLQRPALRVLLEKAVKLRQR